MMQVQSFRDLNSVPCLPSRHVLKEESGGGGQSSSSTADDLNGRAGEGGES